MKPFLKGDYYAEQNCVMGTWHGKTAGRLGLSNQVQKEEFEQLVHNRNPQTGEKITVRDSAKRRAGYDFTFNAPKSVSVVEAITKDEAIREAHKTAIQRAMMEVEANMQYQVWSGKGISIMKLQATLCMPPFEHDTSRPCSPEERRRDPIHP